jgi:molybdopterin/thiamine biosynthesis adenylyltransferase
MTNLILPYTFDPHLHPRHLLLLGVGGTGSHIARGLTRLLYHMKTLRMATPTLHLVDPDHVEDKNIGRQLFSPADIGQPKAQVVAQRLSLAFGIDITWTQAALPPTPYSLAGTIVIEAVDNPQARRQIAQAYPNTLLIACGNHRQSGQSAYTSRSFFEQLRYRY